MEKIHLKNNTYQVWERGTVWFQGTEEECDKYISENQTESKAIPELSDDEIKEKMFGGQFDDQDYDDLSMLFGAKWYREQLKQRHDVVGRSEQFCLCSFVMIMRDNETDVAYCAECGKEVNEQN